MLVDSMIPEARKDGGRAAGLATVLGFALATGLSALSASPPPQRLPSAPSPH